MNEPHLAGLNDKIAAKEFFERILQERDRVDAKTQQLLDERFAALAKALELQADEYKRRLHDLNGEYQRDRQRQQEFVSLEKFEDNLASEKTAREAALLRVNEQFEEYVKRYEQRQREVDQLLTAQKTATDIAERTAEKQSQLAIKATEEQGRKQNRNLVVVGLLLTAIVAIANFLAPHLGG